MKCLKVSNIYYRLVRAMVLVVGISCLFSCTTKLNTLKKIESALLSPENSWVLKSKDFGSVGVGSASTTQAFNFVNTGSAAATGCSAPSITNTTDFTITADTCGTADLANATSCTVTLRANPGATGVKTTTLSRACSVGGTSTTDLNQITVTGVISSLSWTPLTHSFGNVTAVTNTSAFSFQLDNNGGLAATGCTPPVISNTTDFTITADACASNDIAPAGSCIVDVRANPATFGAKTATLSRTCTVGGTVSTTADLITVTGQSPSLAWSPLVKDFGNVNLGSNSSAQNFTLTNSGNIDASSCSTPTISNTTDFTITGDTCTTADVTANGGTCVVTVRGSPASTGAKSATLSRVCTVGGTVSTTTNMITVNGQTPSIAWTPLTYDFGSVAVGANTSTTNFTLTNSGTGSATGCSAPTISNTTDFTITADTCTTADLAASATCTVTVRGNPSTSGAARTATLSRTCTDGGTVTTTSNGIQVTGNVGSPTQIAISSGNNQTGTVGAALGSSFVVEVKDAYGTVVPNATVDWSVASGYGLLGAISSTTNSSGLASNTFTRGILAGTNTIKATINGTSTFVTFTAVGTAAAANAIAILSGDFQAGDVNTALANPLKAWVTDLYGNAVSGHSVTWAVASGGGTLFNATTSTDANGEVTAELTLGAVTGDNTVTATSTTGVVTFTLTSGPRVRLVAGVLGGAGNSLYPSRLNWPMGLVSDPIGNIYVGDYTYRILKIAPNGAMTVFAGSGTSGSTNGTGTGASFNQLKGLTIDGAGNIYAVDSNCIRKITPAAVVTTFAGSCSSSGTTNATGTAARFYNPSQVAVDDAGSVYVADNQNHLIRKITSAGVVTTLAGTAGTAGGTDGTGTAATFNYPRGIVIDRANNLLYVAETGGNRIRKITMAGVVTIFAGNGSSGTTDATGTSARFNSPYRMAIDSSANMYVADWGNGSIRKVTPAAVVTTPMTGVGQPEAVAVDSVGNLFAADITYSVIRKLNTSSVQTILAGVAKPTDGVTDGTGAAARFNFNSFSQQGLAMDSAGDIIMGNNTAMRKITQAGVVTSLSVSGAGVFGPAVDASDNVYFMDSNSYVLKKRTSAGVLTSIAGSGSMATVDGTGTGASFNYPRGVAVDASGNAYVTEQNCVIRKVVIATGVVTTFAGVASNCSSPVNGTGTAAKFGGLSGVVVDSTGNIFVADNGGKTIRKITSAGVVTTFAGLIGTSGTADGASGTNRLEGPGHMTIDSSDTIYFTDGARIRKVTAAGDVTTIAGTLNTTGTRLGALPGVFGTMLGITVTPDGSKIFLTTEGAVVSIY